MPGQPAITVVGAGKGGPSMAAHLISLGFDVVLYEQPDFAEKIQPFVERGGIECSGEVQGFFTPRLMTTDPGTAFAEADLVMVAAMAMGHEAIMRQCLPHVREGALIVFNTGYYAGLRFHPAVRALDRKVILAETDILPYLCVRTGPHSVRIDGIKEEMGAAAIPATDTPAVAERLNKTHILRFKPARHVLEVDLSSMNLLFHAPIVLFNLAACENTKGDFVFYREGVSPGVGKIIHAMDQERIALGRALGIELIDCVAATRMYYADYDVRGDSIDQCLATNLAYAKDVFPMPSIRDFAVFHQDLAYGLPPMIGLGRLLGVPTPTIELIVNVANLVCDADYVREGLGVDRLGIADLDRDELLAYVQTGQR